MKPLERRSVLVGLPFVLSTPSLIRARESSDPELFGAPVNGEDPASQFIQDAIDCTAERGGGIVWLHRPFALDRQLRLWPGVVLKGNGSFNRRTFPNSYNGVRLYPHRHMQAGDNLLEIGGSDFNSNPHGANLDGIAFDGRLLSGEHLPYAVGVSVTDTSDVRFFNSFWGGFDRTHGNGTAVLVRGSKKGASYGTTFDNCIISDCGNGVVYTGLGTTDMRHSNNLFVGVTRSVSLGHDPETRIEEGGAGAQIVNDHFIYRGMPPNGWFLRSGKQAGSLSVMNSYFDKSRSRATIFLGNSRAKLIGNHFLAGPDQKAISLIRIAGRKHRLVACGNSIDLAGSEVRSFVYYTQGSPNGGIISFNLCYGDGPSWDGFVLDQELAVVIAQENGMFTNTGNRRES